MFEAQPCVDAALVRLGQNVESWPRGAIHWGPNRRNLRKEAAAGIVLFVLLGIFMGFRPAILSPRKQDIYFDETQYVGGVASCGFGESKHTREPLPGPPQSAITGSMHADREVTVACNGQHRASVRQRGGGARPRSTSTKLTRDPQ